MSNLNPIPRTTADLETEIAEKDKKICLLEIQIDKLRERLEDLGEDLDEEEDEEVFSRKDHLQIAERLLELSASHLCPASRQHCELWLDGEFLPRESQVNKLLEIYASCEREANLRGEDWA